MQDKRYKIPMGKQETWVGKKTTLKKKKVEGLALISRLIIKLQ